MVGWVVVAVVDAENDGGVRRFDRGGHRHFAYAAVKVSRSRVTCAEPSAGFHNDVDTGVIPRNVGRRRNLVLDDLASVDQQVIVVLSQLVPERAEGTVMSHQLHQ